MNMRIKLIIENTGVKKRKILFLIDTNVCVNIADVSYLIKKRYFPTKGKVELFLDGFLIPPKEDICIIREDDTIHVKFFAEEKIEKTENGNCRMSSESSSELDSSPPCKKITKNAKVPAETKVATGLTKKSPVKSVNILKEGNSAAKKTGTAKSVVKKEGTNKLPLKKTIPLSKLGISHVDKSTVSTDTSCSSSDEEDSPHVTKKLLTTKHKINTQAGKSISTNANTVNASTTLKHGSTKKAEASSSASSDSSSDSSDDEVSLPLDKKNNSKPLIHKKPVSKEVVHKQLGNKSSTDNTKLNVKKGIAQKAANEKSVKQSSSSSSDSSDSSDDEEPKGVKKGIAPSTNVKGPTNATNHKERSANCSTDKTNTKVITLLSSVVNKNNESKKSSESSDSSSDSEKMDNSKQKIDFHCSKTANGKALTSTPNPIIVGNSSNKPGDIVNSKAKNLAKKDVYKNVSQFVVAKADGTENSDIPLKNVDTTSGNRKTQRKRRRKQNRNQYRNNNSATDIQNVALNNNEEDANSSNTASVSSNLRICDGNSNLDNSISNNNNNSNNNSNITNGGSTYENNIEASATKSIVIEKEPMVARDYSCCTKLTAPPDVGSMIAYKILEMSPLQYTPEISEFKEACVKSLDEEKNVLELQMSEVSQTKAKDQVVRGKFEMPEAYDEQSLDAESSNTVLVGWSELIEPCLLI